MYVPDLKINNFYSIIIIQYWMFLSITFWMKVTSNVSCHTCKFCCNSKISLYMKIVRMNLQYKL